MYKKVVVEINFLPFPPYFNYVHASQEVVQSAGTTLNEAKIISSNLTPPLVRTCQKKKKKNYVQLLLGQCYPAAKVRRLASSINSGIIIIIFNIKNMY
jgi:hypothetical protein